MRLEVAVVCVRLARFFSRSVARSVADRRRAPGAWLAGEGAGAMVVVVVVRAKRVPVCGSVHEELVVPCGD